MVVRGYAVAFHGFPRFTKDIDIFFLNSEENIDRIRKCLIAFGFPCLTATPFFGPSHSRMATAEVRRACHLLPFPPEGEGW